VFFHKTSDKDLLILFPYNPAQGICGMIPDVVKNEIVHNG